MFDKFDHNKKSKLIFYFILYFRVVNNSKHADKFKT